MNNYFYIDRNGAQIGPLSIKEIKEKRCLLPETMVWADYLTDWKKASEVEELNEYFEILPATPPPSPSSVVEAPKQKCDIPVKPETWLVWNILSTLLCCLILGVIGIIYSNKADSLWAAGKYDEALKAISIAKNMFIISICTALFFTVGYIILFSIGMLGSFGSLGL